ncbi:hypothetical protein Y032_0070g422 [Ancylostoma ceylanicum]|nr:hypothetical protein Y032_0070g422 [Ancylostoma ceylanicum]
MLQRNQLVYRSLINFLTGGVGNPPDQVKKNDSFAGQFAAALRTTIVVVATNITTKTALYKVGYDYQNKVYSKELSIGDLVLLHDDTVRPKLSIQWKGPFEVVAINRPNVTIRSLSSKAPLRIVHINRLKVYFSRAKERTVSDQNQQQIRTQAETLRSTASPQRRSERLQKKSNRHIV